MSNRKISDTTKNLIAARKLIEKPENWCQWSLAKNIKGEPVKINDPTAFSFCIIGALDKIIGKETPYSYNYNERDLLFSVTSNPAVLNDSSTHKEVLETLDAVIKLSIIRDNS